MALVDMATYVAFGVFETFLPLLLTTRGISQFLIGIIFAVQVMIIAGTKPFLWKTRGLFRQMNPDLSRSHFPGGSVI